MPADRLRTVLVLLVLLGLLLTGCNLPAPEPPIPTTPAGFPPLVSPGAGTAVLGGRVWNDLCSPPASEGCIVIDSFGNLQGDGVMAAGETGIAGVQVSLGAGACPASGLATTFTTGDGAYQFAGLAAGTYCVSVTPPEALPGAPLPGGVWTYPAVGDPVGVAFASVTLADGELRVNVNFGWDYQEAATPTPTQPSLTATPSETPTPTVTPTPTPSSSDPRAQLGEPTWRDAFDSGGNWGLYDRDPARFAIEDGFMVMSDQNADQIDWWLLTWPEVTDFYLESQLTFGTCADGDRAGLVFRGHVTPEGSVDSGYLFGVTCDGRYSLRSWQDPTLSSLVTWTQDSRIQSGENANNRIGVWAKGNIIRLYVNGEQLTEITDTAHAGRMFGLFVGAARTAGFTARVDEIAYWLLP
ncbi:MAG: SdrD B-like domain-containing protein [Chloroflexota bacterium]